jgi:hypothetical protein
MDTTRSLNHREWRRLFAAIQSLIFRFDAYEIHFDRQKICTYFIKHIKFYFIHYKSLFHIFRVIVKRVHFWRKQDDSLNGATTIDVDADLGIHLVISVDLQWFERLNPFDYLQIPIHRFLSLRQWYKSRVKKPLIW